MRRFASLNVASAAASWLSKRFTAASRSTASSCTADAVSSSRRFAALRVCLARHHCCSPDERFSVGFRDTDCSARTAKRVAAAGEATEAATVAATARRGAAKVE